MKTARILVLLALASTSIRIHADAAHISQDMVTQLNSDKATVSLVMINARLTEVQTYPERALTPEELELLNQASTAINKLAEGQGFSAKKAQAIADYVKTLPQQQTAHAVAPSATSMFSNFSLSSSLSSFFSRGSTQTSQPLANPVTVTQPLPNPLVNDNDKDAKTDTTPVVAEVVADATTTNEPAQVENVQSEATVENIVVDTAASEEMMDDTDDFIESHVKFVTWLAIGIVATYASGEYWPLIKDYIISNLPFQSGAIIDKQAAINELTRYYDYLKSVGACDINNLTSTLADLATDNSKTLVVVNNVAKNIANNATQAAPVVAEQAPSFMDNLSQSWVAGNIIKAGKAAHSMFFSSIK